MKTDAIDIAAAWKRGSLSRKALLDICKEKKLEVIFYPDGSVGITEDQSRK